MKSEFNLEEFLYPLKKRWYVILVFLLLGTGLAFYQSSKVVTPPPVYQVSSQVVLPVGDELNLQMLPTYEELLYTEPVLKMINEKLTEKLSTFSGVTINHEENSRVVNIMSSNLEKERAVEITSAVTDVFSKELPAIIGLTPMKVFSSATLEKVQEMASTPVSHTRTYFIFILGALILSLFPIYLVEAIQNTVRTEEEIELAFGAPILGSVKTVSKLPVYGESRKKGRKREA